MTPQDSGTEQFGITYEAAPVPGLSSRVERPSPASSRTTDGIWKVHIPDVAAGQWYFEQLFVNGRRAVRARTPNKFYSYMLDVQEEVLARGGPGNGQSAPARP